MTYRRHYANLTVISLNAEQHAKTCGYWYVVQNDHAAHTAFAHLSSLVKWAAERRLTLPELPAERGVWAWAKIEGSYSCEMHGDMDEFDALRSRALHSITLSNGDHVRALITDEDGHRIVNTLNPNVREREVFDYFANDERRAA